MRNYVYFILLSAFVFTKAKGQSGGIETFVGYGSYDMTDLKVNLKTQLDASGVIPLRITERFPNQLYVGALHHLTFEEFETGIRYSYHSTGGRAHYKDYSGEAGFDITMSAHNLGTFARTDFVNKQKFILKGILAGSLCFTYGNIKNYIIVGKESDLLSVDLYSFSFLLEPFIETKFKILPFLHVGTRLGAALNFGGGLRLAENTKAKLVDNNGKPIRANWSGFRNEITVALLFN